MTDQPTAQPTSTPAADAPAAGNPDPAPALTFTTAGVQLQKIVRTRIAIKSKLTNIAGDLKAVRADLAALPAKEDNPKFIKAATTLVALLRFRDVFNTRLTKLGDLADKAATEDPGQATFADDFDSTEWLKDPTGEEIISKEAHPDDDAKQLRLADDDADDDADDSEDDDADPEPNTRPVGRIEPAPHAGEDLPAGINQHLAASVNELDINDGLKFKLIKNQITTMADLFQMEDEEGGLAQQLCMRGGCNQNQASLIARAFKAYRKQHQDAFIKQMREAAGEDAGAGVGGIGHDTGGKGVGTAKNTRRGKGVKKAGA